MTTDDPGARLDIVPLTPELLPDLATLFSTGDPRWCWCMYFRRRGLDWSNASNDDNRADLERLATSADATAGPAPGLVGVRDGEAIGWVSVGPRADYERLAFSKLLAPVDDRPVWSIVCFVVAARARRRGVANALLAAAIAYARDHGATTLEAYPLHESRGRVSSSSAYVGTQSMFERAGFAVVETRQANAASPPRPIVRLELGPRRSGNPGRRRRRS
jgi:GNAT superfamily N-acetyltransferase